MVVRTAAKRAGDFVVRSQLGPGLGKRPPFSSGMTILRNLFSWIVASLKLAVISTPLKQEVGELQCHTAL